MSRCKWLYVITLMSLLFSVVAPVGAYELKTPTMVEDAQESAVYTLSLPLPMVDVPPDVAPADVPGYYQAALYLRWTEVEAQLDALQRRGWVESYRLLPEANAFQVTATEDALDALTSLGDVRAEVPDTQTLAPAFKAQLDSAVRDVQAQKATPAQRPSANMAGPMDAPDVPEATPEPEEAPESGPAPDVPTYLVRLVTSDDVTPDALASHLAWLETQERIVAYEWLPEAKAFKVTTEGGLAVLAGWPNVETVVPFSKQALYEAEMDYREAQLAERVSRVPQGVLAYTPTTPTVEIYLYEGRVDADSYTNTTTLLTLKNGAGVEKARYTLCPDWSDPDCDGTWWGGGGNWSRSVYFNSNIEPGDTLDVAQNGETAFSVDIPTLTAEANLDTNTVTGQALPDIASTNVLTPPVLYVSLSWDSEYVTTTAAGTFVFTPNMDFKREDNGVVRYYDANGNQVRYSYRVPIVRVRENRHNNRVSGYVADPLSRVEVTLLRGGGGVVATEVMTSSSNGWFYAYFQDPWTGDVDIQAGDQVEVTCNGETMTVDVPSMTADADPDTDLVTGRAPPGITSTDSSMTHTLQVYVDAPSNHTLNVTTTTPTGDYSADFSTHGGIDLGTTGYLRYVNTEEHVVYYNFNAPTPPPVVYVRGRYSQWGTDYYQAENFVSGYVNGFDGTGYVRLEDSTGALKAEDTSVYASPDFSVDFQDCSGPWCVDVDIEPGDRVIATFGGKSTTVAVPEFDATVDVDADTVSGSTTADVVTDTYEMTQTLTVWPNTEYDNKSDNTRPFQSVIPDGGAFTAANPFSYWDGNSGTYVETVFDMAYGDVGHLRYIDAAENRVYYRFQPPPGAPVVYVRGRYSSDLYNRDDTVGGYVPGFDSDIHGTGRVALLDSAGQVRDSQDNVWADSDFYVDFTVDIQAGDTVSATFGGKTTQFTVPEFDIVVDVDRDEITGVVTGTTVTTDTYGQKQTLTLWPNTTQDEQWSQGEPYQSVIPVSGKFTAENPFYYNNDTMTTTLDLQYGMVGHARYIDADGNRVYLRFQPPPGAPVVYVRGCYRNNEYEGPDRVGGYVPGFDSDYHGYGTVTLKDSAGDVKAENTSVWADESFCVNLNVNIEGGDTVVAEFGEHTTEVHVPNFSVTSDADADTVSGNTDADVVTDTVWFTQTLAIWPRSTGDWDNGKHIIPDGNGDFTAANPFYNWANSSNVSVTLDISPGDLGHLRYIDAEENRVYDAFRAPMFYARGDSGDYEDDDYVRAEIDPGMNVTVTLERQGRVWATVKGKSNADGVFEVYLTDMYGNAVYIQAGDEITFAFGDQTVSMTVPPLSASADAEADKVTGVGPTDIVSTTWNMPHTLQVHVDSAWWTQNVTTTNTGAFMVTGTVNLGDSGWLRYVNPAGYYVYEDFHLPVIYARGDGGQYRGENYVAGYLNQVNVQATVNLQRGGATLATAKDITNDNARYEVWFRDLYGNAVNIAGGDVIEVIAAGETVTMAVPAFDNVASDPDADTVTGSTDASVVTDTISDYGDALTLSIWPNQLDDSIHSPFKNVLPDSSGVFTATNPFDVWMGVIMLDIQADDVGHLRYIDGRGNYTYVRFQADQDLDPTFYIRGWYERAQTCDTFGCYNYDNEDYRSSNFFGLRLDDGCAADGSNVGVTLRDANDEVKAQGTLGLYCYNNWDAYHSRGEFWFSDVYGNAQAIAAGDTIEVLLAGVPYTYTVRELYAGDVTQDAPGTVRGTAPGGITLDDPQNPNQDTPPSLWAQTSWGDNTYLTTTNPFTRTLVGNGTYVYTTTRDIYQYGGTFDLRFKDETPNTTLPHTTWYRKNFAGVAQEPVVYVRGYYWGKEYEAENYVGGYVPNYCDYGAVVLKDATGKVKTEEPSIWACNSFGVYLDQTVEAGDTVEATFGDLTTVVNVPAFDVTSDSVNDRVTGTTDADVVTDTYGMTQTLAVWPVSFDDDDYGKHVLPDARGAFVATNPFYDEGYQTWDMWNIDWNPDQYGHLRYINADGNRVYARFVALYPDPFIRVHKDSNNTYGWLTQGSGTVTVTLKQGDTVKSVAYDEAADNGSFNVNFFDSNGAPVYVRQGDTVVVTGGKDNVTLPIPALTGAANTTTDQVTGEGPAEALLEVTAGGTPQTVETGGDGTYTADFSGREDIEPGDYVEVNYRNADGHDVYVTFYAGPKLNVQLHTYYAWGYAPAANVPVTMTLMDGATVKGVAHTTSDNANFFNAFFYNSVGQRALIEGGNTVKAEFGDGSTATMDAASLTAAVDADADTVSGTGPANDKLGVSVGGFNDTVDTDNAGKWNADPGAQGEDITPGEQVHVRHINTDHHETWLYAVAPVVYVRGEGNWGAAYRADNYVRGHAAVRGAAVDVTLKRGTETIATNHVYLGTGSTAYSFYLYDDFGQAADIQNGDQVVLSTPDTETVNVPTLDATVDAENDTVTGTGPANATLGVYVDWTDKSVTTDGDGKFSAEFNIDPGDYAYVRYYTPDGNWVHARFQAGVEAEDAAIYARWDGNSGEFCNACASGWAGVGNVVATVSLSRDGTTLATQTDLTSDMGWFNVAFSNSEGDPLAIAEGDVLGVQASGQAVTMTVAALTAQVNRDTGVLYGTGPASADLYYWYRNTWGNSWNGTTATDAKGSYNAALDLYGTYMGYIRYTHETGHRTYLGWASPYFGVQEYSNFVYGYTYLNTPVDVRLLDSQGREQARVSATSDGGGYFNANFKDAAGEPIFINPNDQVVFDAGTPVTVPVVLLDATVNVVTDTVTGTGPAGDDLQVDACGSWRVVTADATDGSFTADFSDECDFESGQIAWVNHYNDDHNRVFAEFRASLIRVNYTGDIVDGWVRHYAPVNLKLTRPGVTSTLATAQTTAKANGFFSAFFQDAEGNTVDLQPGDTVQVTASPTISVNIVDISAALNTATDVITGTGPANAVLRLWAYNQGGGFTRFEVVETGATGNFSVDFSGEMDLTAQSYAYIRYTDAQGNHVGYATTPSRATLLEDAEDAIQDAGASVVASSFSVAHDDDLTPPLHYTGGAERLIFASEGGTLVLTYIDGSVVETGQTLVIVDNAKSGLWKAQVDKAGGEGAQYAIAVGKAEIKYDLYLPVVTRVGGTTP